MTHQPTAVETQQTDDSSRRRRDRCWSWCILSILLSAVLLRMFVVADDEIIPQVYDSTFYAQTATYYLSDNSFSILPLHRSGMPILAWVSAELGIPYKLMLDLLLVAMALAAGWTLFRWTRSKLASVAVTLAILLHPWFIVHSQMFMTEPLISVLLVAVLLSAIPLICKPFNEWPLLLALTSCVTATIFVLTRPEFSVLVGFYIVVWLVFLIRNWRNLNMRIWSQAGGWRLVFLILPVVCAWSATHAVKIVNYNKFGVYATNSTEADGFTDLMAALYSIEPDEKIMYAPVTLQSLRAACDASQVLDQRRAFILDTERSSFKIAERVVGLKNEIGPWLNWHLIDCFAGIDKNSNKRMRVAARQIKEAQSRGELKERFAMFPMDPVWREWLPKLPGHIFNSFKMNSCDLAVDYGRLFDSRMVRDLVKVSLFDQGLMRRGGAGRHPVVSFHGKAIDNVSANIVAVQFLTADKKFIVQVPTSNRIAGQPEFSTSFSGTQHEVINGGVAVKLIRSKMEVSPDGVETESISYSEPLAIPQRATKQQNFFHFLNADGTVDRLSWSLSVNRYQQENGPRIWLRGHLFLFPWFGLALATLVAFLCGLASRLDRRQRVDLFWIFLISLALISGRNLLYCLIDVWLAWGLNRYVEPNLFLTIFAAAVFAFGMGSLCSSWFRGELRTSSTETEAALDA